MPHTRDVGMDIALRARPQRALVHSRDECPLLANADRPGR
jgi:hypothetical protein